MRSFACLIALFALTFGVPATAQEASGYTVTAEMMPIGSDPEEPTAELSHIAYTLDGADPANRPITFLFNGGPGAASIYLHILAVGPVTLDIPGDGTFPEVPARLRDNPHSWLDFTDLVFVDPVDTGYSRALPAEGEDDEENGDSEADPKPFFDNEADIEAMGQFISLYLTRHERWSSPKAIAGESYGGRRVAEMVGTLLSDFDIIVNKAVMISPALGDEVPRVDLRWSLLQPAFLLPTYAAAAASHGRNELPADGEALEDALVEVERFALGDMLTGLARIDRDDPAEPPYDRIAELTGLDRTLVESNRGRIDQNLFAKELLRDQSLILDRYDASRASADPLPDSQRYPGLDRSLFLLNGVMSAPFLDYVRGEIGFKSDRRYEILNLRVNRAWDRSETIGTATDVGIAMTLNDNLDLFVAHGVHDTITPYFATRYLLEQSILGDEARSRVSFGTYAGGHMFYLYEDSLAQFTADIAAFYEQ